MKLLRIDSSARNNSVSRQMTDKFVTEWLEKNPGGEVIERDLTLTTLPAITEEWSSGSFTDPQKRTAAQRQALAMSDIFIGEIEAADVIVIGAPMYNFAISAPLKGWIDNIVRPGRTVGFGPTGPQGLLADKKVFILTARGGSYRPGSARAGHDYQEPYLRLILGYVGLSDVTFLHADNQLRAEAEATRNSAFQQLSALVVAASSATAQV
jgi:FMN-dependent NADH-azoreductase